MRGIRDGGSRNRWRGSKTGVMTSRVRRLGWLLCCAAMVTGIGAEPPAAGGGKPSAADSPRFPGAQWEVASPQAVGLDADALGALGRFVGGNGCVVRHGFLAFSWGDPTRSGDVASAMKPVLSLLLLLSIQEGRVGSVDEPVARIEPRLESLNDGKDSRITWRHLASQTSGYGLSEAPGAAYAYNDYAIALYYDTLMQGVFRTNGTAVFESRLARPLQFEDRFTFEAFGPLDRPGRLAVSVRDFARIGWLVLRGGTWNGTAVVDPALLRTMVSSPVEARLPLTSGRETAMLPGQRTLGGSRNITPVGPGCYSFNWWLNRPDAAGRRLFVDAPADTLVASGHGGRRMLWILPTLDLVVCWNDSGIDDHDRSPGNPESRCNQAARLLLRAVVPEPGPRPASGR